MFIKLLNSATCTLAALFVKRALSLVSLKLDILFLSMLIFFLRKVQGNAFFNSVEIT